MGAVEEGEVLGMRIITECWQYVGKRPVDMERLNKIDRGVIIEEEVGLRRKDVISSWPGKCSLEVRRLVVDCEWRAKVVVGTWVGRKIMAKKLSLISLLYRGQWRQRRMNH